MRYETEQRDACGQPETHYEFTQQSDKQHHTVNLNTDFVDDDDQLVFKTGCGSDDDLSEIGQPSIVST
jgi:uncharacterized protein YeaC (DUF1315 family)